MLVVDDEPDVVDAMKQLLELDGYQAITAHNADEALVLIDQQPPICVVLDLGLPHTSGVELLRRVRERHGAGIVLIVLTGSTEPDDESAAEAAGADYVLHKPLDMDKLRRMLPPVR